MVRTVHTNHFYEILAQISDPKIEFLTKTHFLKNDHVQNFWKWTFWPEKKPAGWFHSQTKVVNTFSTQFGPNYPPTLLCRGMCVIDYFCSSRITCMVCWWTPRKIHGNWCRQAHLTPKITPCALRPMPYAPCLMPCALRPMPHAPHLNLFF